MLYFLINKKQIQIRSMLAAGIVQDKVVEEAVEGEGGEEETTVLLPLRLKSVPFLSS